MIPLGWGGCAEGFRCVLGLNTEEGKLLGRGALRLPQGLAVVPFGVAFSGCFPVPLLMSAPGTAFRASAIFIKAVLSTFI